MALPSLLSRSKAPFFDRFDGAFVQILLDPFHYAGILRQAFGTDHQGDDHRANGPHPTVGRVVRIHLLDHSGSGDAWAEIVNRLIVRLRQQKPRCATTNKQCSPRQNCSSLPAKDGGKTRPKSARFHSSAVHLGRITLPDNARNSLELLRRPGAIENERVVAFCVNMGAGPFAHVEAA